MCTFPVEGLLSGHLDSNIEQHETKRERLLMVVWPLVLLLSGEEGVRQMKTNGQEG